MSDYFVYNGVNSSTWFARVFPTDSMLAAPEHLYNVVSVPGRSGTLLMDLKAYNNIMREYDVQIVGDTDLQKLAAMRNHLASASGYLRLTDTFDPTHYFMAAYTEAFAMTGDFRSMRRGRGTISFECKPQRFLLSGETPLSYSSNGMIVNPTRYPSKPLIVVTTNTSSACLLGIGSTGITITRQGTITIDCETGRAYNGATALDSYVSLNTIDYPVLAPGSTGIALGTGISRVMITPRWWEL